MIFGRPRRPRIMTLRARQGYLLVCIYGAETLSVHFEFGLMAGSSTLPPSRLPLLDDGHGCCLTQGKGAPSRTPRHLVCPCPLVRAVDFYMYVPFRSFRPLNLRFNQSINQSIHSAPPLPGNPQPRSRGGRHTQRDARPGRVSARGPSRFVSRVWTPLSGPWLVVLYVSCAVDPSP